MRFSWVSAVGIGESAGATQSRFPRRRDKVDAAEEVHEAGAGDAVEDLKPPLFTVEEACVFHHGEVLGYRCDVASRGFGQILHASLPVQKHLHEQEPGGMGHGLDDEGTAGSRRFASFKLPFHSWQLCQIDVPVNPRCVFPLS